jgi:hypothetical protein
MNLVELTRGTDKVKTRWWPDNTTLRQVCASQRGLPLESTGAWLPTMCAVEGQLQLGQDATEKKEEKRRMASEVDSENVATPFVELLDGFMEQMELAVRSLGRISEGI